MAQTKVDYLALEREFITSKDDISLREIAKREGMSNSTISDYARKHNWLKKREEQKDKVLSEFLDRSAEQVARRLARMSEMAVDVLEGQLVRFAQQLTQHLDPETGQPTNKEPIYISPKDVQEAIRLIQLLRGGPTERHEDNVRGVTVHTLDPRLVEALGEAARRSHYARAVGPAGQRALPGGAAGGPRLVEEGESA